MLFHDSLQDMQPIELSLDFVQQCDDFHQYDILQSIIKYVRNYPTCLSIDLAESKFCIWPQYIVLVDNFIGWADNIENFSEAELYYTETYDLLADSLELYHIYCEKLYTFCK